MLGLGSRASSMSCISVTTELQLLSARQLQNVLESCANLHQSVFAAALSSGPCPETNSVEALSHIDDHAHDFIISFIFESLTNRSQLSV